MKINKRVISLLLVAIMMFNSIPVGHATAGELTINGSLTDAITDMEYGWDGSTYRFAEDVLEGVQAGDEVYLVADVITTDPLTAGSTVAMELSNFRLEGANATDYMLPDLTEYLPVQTEIQILPKTIVICPAQTYIYYGQDIPEDGTLTEVADYSSQLVGDDDVHVSCSFEILFDGSSNVGVYDVNLLEEVQMTGDDASNYQVEVAENIEFSILAYKTGAEAVTEDGFDGNYGGKASATLTAPEGFLISATGGMDNSEWKRSISITLEETQSGSIIYYLRNNDSENNEYYRAICEKTHNYTSLPTPVVTGIEVALVDPNANIQFRDEGVFANNNVLVTVYVSGGKIAQDTTIFLDKNGGQEYVIVKAEDAEDKNGVCIYQASFEIESYDGESEWYNLDAFAENIAGVGEKYSVSNPTDTFAGSDTKVTAPLVIDRKAANVTIHSIDGNHNNAIRAEFSIDDPDSGVFKVEYKWDQGEYQLFEYDSSKTKFFLELPWDQAEDVEGGKHTLTLLVTDQMGNVTVPAVSLTDETGTDFLPPVIESVEFRTHAGDKISQTADGNFSNKTVNIIIRAHDSEMITDSMSRSSGVQKVVIEYTESGKAERAEAVWNEELSAYVMTVNADRKLTGIRITVIDNCNLSSSGDLKTLAGIESGDLCVEDDVPSIGFENFDGLGHKYNDEEQKIWIGSEKDNDELVITFADPGKISGGIASVVIKDNEDAIFSWSKGSREKVPSQYAHGVSKFTDGDHVVTVEVVDSCGNRYTASVTFTKDTSKPKESQISVESEGLWIDEDLWFDVNDNIEFFVGTTDGSRLAFLKLNINGEVLEFDYSKIIAVANGYGVEIDTKWLNENGIDLSNENTYTISATIWDLAWNSYELDAVTVHVDKVAPVIERITVQKSDESALEKILRILSFGIFANDDLTFRVYTSDAENDSGLDYGTIQGSETEEPQNMDWDEENGCYWFEVPAKEKALVEGTLRFVVRDKFGKHAEAHPIIQEEMDPDSEDANETNSFYVMIETELPWLGFELLAGDGSARTDDQIWYNENKDLSLSVHDAKSGIYSVSFMVNGVAILQDKVGNVLITEPEERITDTIVYYFDTDGLIEIAGKATDGKYNIEIIVTDNAGNEKRCEQMFFVDETPPQIDKISVSPATVDDFAETDVFIEHLEYGLFFKENFIATVHVSDAGPSSGLYELNYRLVPYDGGVQQTQITETKKIVDGKVVIEAPDGFVGQLFVEALDYVNNRSGEKTTKAFVVDNSAPTITITKNAQTEFHDADGNPLYTEMNSFTVVIEDDVAGLEEINYHKDAEQFPYDQQIISISDRVYQPGDVLDDGWEVVSVNCNLVTQVRKTFDFTADDNNISLHFEAKDRSHNRTDTVSSEVFTVDTIAPVISVVFREDVDDNVYYNQNRVADITVTERNFDANLISVLIQNTFGAVPGYSFNSASLTEHTATIDFGEGDYTFEVNGRDLSGRDADVTYSGGNEKLFYVDKTVPAIEENFAAFANDRENSFNVDKTATIKITEHNFDSELTNLRITRKATGEEHSQSGMVDVTAELMAGARWIRSGDTHSISFTFAKDAVYYIQMSPVDLASNQGDTRSTVVFEIDKTVPVVSTKNGNQTGAEDTEFLDVYPYDRKDDPIPTVTFTDQNILHIEYTLTTYIPEYLEAGLVRIKPKTVQGIVDGNLFALEEFAADGIYALELVAVDVAGNRSALNANTYARMVNQDVLAFILDSNSAEGTGLYSLEYENGDAISKKPNDFMNLQILVMAPTGTDIDIVLRDTNGNDIQTESSCTTDSSVYGIDVNTFVIDEGFFRDNFQDDVDMEMNLTVRNQNYRIDLANIHIDSVAPTCDLPEELFDWRWFAGTADRTFTIKNISEMLEKADCKVYDNGVLIPFEYSEEEDTITFTLSRGWHNIGIILCDAAGNSNITPEIMNLHIGNFWIILVASALALFAAALVVIVVYRRKLIKREMTEDS